MSDFLARMRVLQRTRVESAHAFRDSLAARAAERGAARSLEAVLRAPRARFLFECKAASPSRGAIAREPYDPAELARSYLPAADGISVLTEPEYFGGSLEHLAAVRSAVSVPLLRKDFILHPIQVLEGRAFGADAVLLIASFLSWGELRVCLAEADRLGMDALVEVRDRSEIGRALEAGARLLGINNRDLRTLQVDPNRARELAPFVPKDHCVIAESGYGAPARVREHSGQVDGFLIGAATAGAADPRLESRRFAFGRTKVCGLTRPEDAARAGAAGATHLGFVRWPGSPRYVPDLAPFDAPSLPRVGVYVSPDRDTVERDARVHGLSAVQIHGSVPAGLDLGPDCQLWRAGPVDDGPPAGCDRWVIDAGRIGGTGRTFDWSRIPPEAVPRAWLAGGIGPHNGAQARARGCFGLDASSGLEASPGRKDPSRLDAFFRILRPESRCDDTAVIEPARGREVPSWATI